VRFALNLLMILVELTNSTAERNGYTSTIMAITRLLRLYTRSVCTVLREFVLPRIDRYTYKNNNNNSQKKADSLLIKN